jgi:hypothetical protein
VHHCYKLAELEVSFAYDYFYTKLGARFLHPDLLNSRFVWLLTAGSTSAALVLFACSNNVAADDGHYRRADVAVSYVLLIGAVILEVISMSIVSSSYWVYSRNARKWDERHSCAGLPLPMPRSAVIFSVVKHFHAPEGAPQWSHKLAQNNLIDGVVNAARASCVGRLMLRVGIRSDTTTRVAISQELKTLLLDKLLEFAPAEEQEGAAAAAAWDPSSKFTCHWARSELRRQSSPSDREQLLALLSIKSNSFLLTVLTWHIATDICFFLDLDDDGGGEAGSSAGSSSGSRSPSSMTMSRELSNYVMYLCAEHGVMSGNDGHLLLHSARGLLIVFSLDRYYHEGGKRMTRALVERINGTRALAREKIEDREPSQIAICAFVDAVRLSEGLRGKTTIEAASDRWAIIMNVWMEMLCYMAVHMAPAGFHTKRLSMGGEFITHVKVLMYNLGLSIPSD